MLSIHEGCIVVFVLIVALAGVGEQFNRMDMNVFSALNNHLGCAECTNLMAVSSMHGRHTLTTPYICTDTLVSFGPCLVSQVKVWSNEFSREE